MKMTPEHFAATLAELVADSANHNSEIMRILVEIQEGSEAMKEFDPHFAELVSAVGTSIKSILDYANTLSIN